MTVAPKVGIRPARASAAGNGIFGCGDRAPRITAKTLERPQRKNPGIKSTEIPPETPYLASCRKRAVCGALRGRRPHSKAHAPGRLIRCSRPREFNSLRLSEALKLLPICSLLLIPQPR